MKHALCFIAGIAVGVIAVFVYQVFGEPVLPAGWTYVDRDKALIKWIGED